MESRAASEFQVNSGPKGLTRFIDAGCLDVSCNRCTCPAEVLGIDSVEEIIDAAGQPKGGRGLPCGVFASTGMR